MQEKAEQNSKQLDGTRFPDRIARMNHEEQSSPSPRSALKREAENSHGSTATAAPRAAKNRVRKKVGKQSGRSIESREAARKKSTLHGGRYTAEYSAWSGMRYRCLNRNSPKYKTYGGRGISICERWSKFENFITDMGERPSPMHSIDRIDNNGNYEPGNCRWATKKQQNRNQRSNRLIKAYRKTATTAEWSEISGVKSDTIEHRILRGWNVEDAIFKPADKRFLKPKPQPAAQ